LRVTGALLVGLGASDLFAPLFPMHRREALARGGGIAHRHHAHRPDGREQPPDSARDWVRFYCVRKRFRLYSVATILVLVVTGGLTATQASRLEANLPTPWAGLMERISIGGYLLWQVVLATVLMRPRASGR
jgi:hypothetical protein